MAKQLVRSSGFVVANYIEANEKLGDKDFLLEQKYLEKEQKNQNIGYDYFMR